MKKLPVFILCFFGSISILAQAPNTPYFELNNLPKEDIIVLDSGWKFHPGDNLNWASPSFDDSNWQKIDPTKNIYHIPELKEAQIGWLRLTLHVGEELRDKTITMVVEQVGASEIYLNGALIKRYGKVSANFAQEETYNPFHETFSVHFSGDEVQRMAVRYSFTKGNFYPRHTSTFFLHIPAPAFLKRHNLRYLQMTIINSVAAGVFVVLCLLHFILYAAYPIRKTNLYLSFYAFSQCCLTVQVVFELLIHTATEAFLVEVVTNVAFCVSAVFFLILVYELFQQKKGTWFKLLILASLLPLVVAYGFHITVQAQNAFFLAILIIIYLDVLRICIIAFRKALAGGKIMLIGQLITVSAFIVLALNVSFYTFGSYFPVVLVVCNAIVFLTLPLCLSVILALEVAQTNRSLKQQLEEVNRLSEKTITQEQEKQQILATQNERLEQQVTERTKELKHSLEELKATQAQLIQREKMASLGELTSGIAHEIQNPLNFVNNFSEVNKELFAEMKNELLSDNKEEAIAIANDIEQNLEKITHHGNRADAIVKGMLQHSRASKGEKQLTDINALADEYLRLAYHGMRAKNKSFNAVLETHFYESMGRINVIPQDIGRVLLNLFNNAFYSVSEKKKRILEGYEPKVSVSTRQTGNQFEISVQDNGLGIPGQVINKIFQPFFTTKPTGEGTGLGLSLSYDIIKAYGGVIKVEAKEGKGAEFVIQLKENI